MEQRRLAAIMFTDIQGYTALMQQSEAEALRVREVHREIFNSNTEQFHGEIIQYYGDGTLSIFESAVDAVQCGIAMQHAFQQEPQIPIRIGIHSGDIVLNEDDIIGDAVNIASRVESLAVPGGVLISDKVFDEIKNKDDIQTTSLGKFKFKNVKHPIEVYAISNEDLERSNAEKTSAVHFMRFELEPDMVAALRSGAALKMGSSHESYHFSTDVEQPILDALLADLDLCSG